LRIFISIAAYRDPQLIPTIADCLSKARYPEQCRFGICWQHGSEEVLRFGGDPRFRIIDVHWGQSRGACWARAEIMRLWEGEEYYLQLDSHHRFAQDWDIRLLRYAERAGTAKPIITTYGAPFTPEGQESLAGVPLQINFDRFTEDSIAVFRPGAITGLDGRTRPLRARFLSAHFLFTTSSFVEEVPYDPELYFIGEEITLTIRAFTSGYDLFHPLEVIIWHEYTRNYRRKHWDDHVTAEGIEHAWHELDSASKAKVTRFLTRPYVGRYGCGSIRSFQEYEVYAGLNFYRRSVQDYTLRGEEPPSPRGTGTPNKIYNWRVQIIFDRAALAAAALNDPHFWYVGIHDESNTEIFRKDVSSKDLPPLLAQNSPYIIIEDDVVSDRVPMTWTVWPVSCSQGWLAKLHGVVIRRLLDS
jgi:hypothetical protein